MATPKPCALLSQDLYYTVSEKLFKDLLLKQEDSTITNNNTPQQPLPNDIIPVTPKPKVKRNLKQEHINQHLQFDQDIDNIDTFYIKYASFDNTESVIDSNDNDNTNLNDSQRQKQMNIMQIKEYTATYAGLIWKNRKDKNFLSLPDQQKAVLTIITSICPTFNDLNQITLDSLADKLQTSKNQQKYFDIQTIPAATTSNSISIPTNTAKTGQLDPSTRSVGMNSTNTQDIQNVGNNNNNQTSTANNNKNTNNSSTSGFDLLHPQYKSIINILLPHLNHDTTPSVALLIYVVLTKTISGSAVHIDNVTDFLHRASNYTNRKILALLQQSLLSSSSTDGTGMLSPRKKVKEQDWNNNTPPPTALLNKIISSMKQLGENDIFYYNEEDLEQVLRIEEYFMAYSRTQSASNPQLPTPLCLHLHQNYLSSNNTNQSDNTAPILIPNKTTIQTTKTTATTTTTIENYQYTFKMNDFSKSHIFPFTLLEEQFVFAMEQALFEILSTSFIYQMSKLHINSISPNNNPSSSTTTSSLPSSYTPQPFIPTAQFFADIVDKALCDYFPPNEQFKSSLLQLFEKVSFLFYTAPQQLVYLFDVTSKYRRGMGEQQRHNKLQCIEGLLGGMDVYDKVIKINNNNNNSTKVPWLFNFYHILPTLGSNSQQQQQQGTNKQEWAVKSKRSIFHPLIDVINNHPNNIQCGHNYTNNIIKGRIDVYTTPLNGMPSSSVTSVSGDSGGGGKDTKKSKSTTTTIDNNPESNDLSIINPENINNNTALTSQPALQPTSSQQQQQQQQDTLQTYCYDVKYNKILNNTFKIALNLQIRYQDTIQALSDLRAEREKQIAVIQKKKDKIINKQKSKEKDTTVLHPLDANSNNVSKPVLNQVEITISQYEQDIANIKNALNEDEEMYNSTIDDIKHAMKSKKFTYLPIIWPYQVYEDKYVQPLIHTWTTKDIKVKKNQQQILINNNNNTHTTTATITTKAMNLDFRRYVYVLSSIFHIDSKQAMTMQYRSSSKETKNSNNSSTNTRQQQNDKNNDDANNNNNNNNNTAHPLQIPNGVDVIYFTPVYPNGYHINGTTKRNTSNNNNNSTKAATNMTTDLSSGAIFNPYNATTAQNANNNTNPVFVSDEALAEIFSDM